MNGCAKTLKEALGLAGVGWVVWWLVDAGLLTSAHITDAVAAFRAGLQHANPGVDFARDIHNWWLNTPGGWLVTALILLGNALIWSSFWRVVAPDMPFPDEAELKELEKRQYDGLAIMSSGFYLAPILLCYAYSLAHAMWLMTNPLWQGGSQLLFLDWIAAGVSAGSLMSKRFFPVVKLAGAAIGVFNLALALAIYGGV